MPPRKILDLPVDHAGINERQAATRVHLLAIHSATHLRGHSGNYELQRRGDLTRGHAAHNARPRPRVDSLGRLIDGDHNGQVGGSAVAVLTENKVTLIALARTSGAETMRGRAD